MFVKAFSRTISLAAVAALASVGAPLLAQSPKVAVIDSDRIVAESTKGKAALAEIQQAGQAKQEELRNRQQELVELRKRFEEGRLSLSEDKLADLQKQIEDKATSTRRFQEDAQREMEKLQQEKLAKIEREVITIIGQVGEEQGYTMIFNKFRSGLVYASDGVDITDVILERYNASSGQ